MPAAKPAPKLNVLDPVLSSDLITPGFRAWLANHSRAYCEIFIPITNGVPLPQLYTQLIYCDPELLEVYSLRLVDFFQLDRYFNR